MSPDPSQVFWSCPSSVRINCLSEAPVATYVNLTQRGKRMDGGHLGREILLLLLVWQLVESVELWRVVRNYEQQAKKRRSKRKKRQKRSPQEFQGLTKKPLCEQCVADEDQERPSVRAAPPLLVQKRGRPRQVDTAHQYCPNELCDYYGWTGRGNICANGHPNGGQWRQLYCGVCRTYFLETKGTIFYGKRLMARLMVRVLAGLAEGLGIRAVGRVFELDIDASYLERLPRELPEGMRQLVAIAREKNHELEVFLMDEPMSHLDAAHHVRMRVFIQKIVRDMKKTTLISFNDPEDALAISDFIGVIEKGQLLQFGLFRAKILW